MTKLERDKHIGYLLYLLKDLPQPYSSQDVNRLTLLHFAVQSLDVLGALTDDNPYINKPAIIEWIYNLQLPPPYGGFRGGTFLGARFGLSEDLGEYDGGHIAMTYTALCTLLACGDDLSRVDKGAVVRGLIGLQREDGSFQCTSIETEHDMRFLYCACAISHLLNDWSGIRTDRAYDFILSSRSYDGAIGLNPGQEGHGGSTFCAIASLALMGRLQDMDPRWRRRLVKWCTARQVGGMQGRPNKPEDTCYSYWVGATLFLLGEGGVLDHERLHGYVLSCQTQWGGFSKVLGSYPDLLHTFYSLAYLSLPSRPMDEKGETSEKDDERLLYLTRELSPVNPLLGMCQHRIDALQLPQTEL